MSNAQLQNCRDRQAVLHATIAALRGDLTKVYILPSNAWVGKGRDLNKR